MIPLDSKLRDLVTLNIPEIVTKRNKAGDMAIYGDDIFTTIASNAILETEQYQLRRKDCKISFKDLTCKCCGAIKCSPYLLQVITMLKIAYLMRTGHKDLSITSGYRCPKHNAEVGGAIDSGHILGIAADIIAPDFDTLTQLCEDAMAKGWIGRMGLNKAKKFIHIETIAKPYRPCYWEYDG